MRRWRIAVIAAIAAGCGAKVQEEEIFLPEPELPPDVRDGSDTAPLTGDTYVVLGLHSSWIGRLGQFGQARGVEDSWLTVLTRSNEQPDVDLDGDGHECIFDATGDGQITRCCDATPSGQPCVDNRNRCSGIEIPPVISDQPWTCVLDPRIADAYSASFSFGIYPAHVALE